MIELKITCPYCDSIIVVYIQSEEYALETKRKLPLRKLPRKLPLLGWP